MENTTKNFINDISNKDEKILNEFSTYTTLYSEFLSASEIQNKLKYALYSYAPPSVESVMPVLKKAALSAGITVAAAGVSLLVKGKKRK